MNFYDTYRIHQHEANERLEKIRRQRIADEANRDRQSKNRKQRRTR